MIPSLKNFFEKGAVNEIFLHVSNFIHSTLVFAAGVYTFQYADGLDLWGILNVQIASYIVMGVGFFLMLLNFIDGLYKISKRKNRLILYALVSLIYLFISVRLVEILITFRIRT